MWAPQILHNISDLLEGFCDMLRPLEGRLENAWINAAEVGMEPPKDEECAKRVDRIMTA